MSIGKRIKARREELKMTQTDLAAKTGYKSRSSINKIELDGRNLPQKKIALFAKALDTTPGYLMGWRDDPEEGTHADIQRKFTKYIAEIATGERKEPTREETHNNRINNLLMHFERLNPIGQLEAIKRIEELTYIEKYINKSALKDNDIISSDDCVELAARGGKIKMDKEKAKSLAKSANEAPNSSRNRDMF